MKVPSWARQRGNKRHPAGPREGLRGGRGLQVKTEQRRPRAWRRLAVAGVALLALAGMLAAAVLFINQGPLPARWRAAVADGLSEWLGADVTVAAARLAGPGRLVLEGVQATGDAALFARQVTVGFAFWDLEGLVRAPLDAIRWVQVRDFELALPGAWLAARGGWPGAGAASPSGGRSGASGDGGHGPDAGTGPAARLSVELISGRLTVEAGPASLAVAVEGRLVLDEGAVLLHGLRTQLPGLAVTWRGSLWPVPDLHARLEASDLAAAVDALPGPWATALPVDLRGRTAGELWLAGAWDAPRAWGRLRLDGLVVDAQAVAQRPYALTGGTLAWSYWPSQGLELALDASRDDTRLRVEGAVTPEGALDLSVTAADLDLPADVAPLARWGAAGRADFTGRLAGTLHRPVLAGQLMADGGRLLGQPFASLAGQLRLSREEFAFSRVRIAQGPSEYHLDGRVGFGAGPGEPGHLQLEVRAQRGRAEALLGALGWRVPVQAALSGSLVFEGPLGAVQARGDVALAEGVAWGQPFDQLAGQFHYGPAGFTIVDAAGRVRGGTVHARGSGQPEGPWELQVKVAGVPVQAVAALRGRWPAVSGRLDFQGTVGRAPGQPVPAFAGELAVRHLRIGPLDFSEARGPVRWEGGILRTEGFTLRRPGGGTYVAAGTVRDGGGDPQLHLDVTVQGESLADVLAWAGLRLPLLAPSGRVAAQVALQGTLHRPEARVQLEAPDVHGLGYRTGVAVEIRLQDGRVEVEELSRPG